MDLRVHTVAVDSDAPLLSHLPDAGGVVWLRQGEGFVGWGEAARIDAGTGPERFSRAAEAWADLLESVTVMDDVGIAGTGPVAFGSFAFDDRSHGSVLVVPEVVVGRREGVTFLTRASATDDLHDTPPAPAIVAEGPAPRGDRVRYAGSSVPDVLWLAAVAAAVDRLEAGELEKVVLARDHAVWSKEPFDARDLAWRLAERFPSCFTFSVDGLVGATPELLIRRLGKRFESLVLAGSARRGADDVEDTALGEELLGSDKVRREHDLAARSVYDVLGPLCDDLAFPGVPELLRLDNVQHLASRFVGTLHRADDLTALDLAARLHPTAAVGGTPTSDAVELIRELEGMDRGRYTGPVGWVDRTGDGEWGIALRCAQLAGARARLFAGAGIVVGSLPEDELEETRLKLRAMQGAFGEELS